MIKRNIGWMCIITGAILTFCLSACQATPEALIVHQKDTEALMEKIYTEDETVIDESDTFATNENKETKNDYRIIEHTTLKMELENGVYLSVDKDLISPNTDGFPIVTYKRKVLTDEDISNITEVLLQGNTLHELRDDRVMTQSELEAMIVAIKRDYSSLNSEGAKMKGITDINDLYVLRDEALMEYYEELENAPEEIQAEVHNMDYSKHGLEGEQR